MVTLSQLLIYMDLRCRLYTVFVNFHRHEHTDCAGDQYTLYTIALWANPCYFCLIKKNYAYYYLMKLKYLNI